VVLSGTREAPLAALAAELGERARVVLADLSDPAAADRLVAASEAAAGPTHILVNNAGMWRDNLGVRMKDDEWAKVIEVNLTAPFKLARGVMRGMLRRRWGRIISIGSLSGTIGNPGQANYSAAKAGLTGMSKALAYEVATRGITVNVVAPGFVSTPMVDDLLETFGEKLMGRIPLGRMGLPAEIAAGVVYLASEEAAYVTGTTLHINGGMSMI
jgi:3-oxoacyl-[acyl-carrier protein] reductase